MVSFPSSPTMARFSSHLPCHDFFFPYIYIYIYIYAPDNASIHFDNVVLPRSALLSKYSEVDAVGNYVQKIAGTSSIDMIGQRLYSGRTVIADSALVFCRSLFAATKKYADAKDCWAPGKSYPKLSQLPQLQQLFYEADQRLSQLEVWHGVFLRLLFFVHNWVSFTSTSMFYFVWLGHKCC